MQFVSSVVRPMMMRFDGCVTITASPCVFLLVFSLRLSTKRRRGQLSEHSSSSETSQAKAASGKTLSIHVELERSRTYGRPGSMPLEIGAQKKSGRRLGSPKKARLADIFKELETPILGLGATNDLNFPVENML